MESNTREHILSASRELLQRIVAANGVSRDLVACVIFTTTPDLDAAFPAAAARQMGWTSVALLGSQEMGVKDSLDRCLRILLLVNTEKRAEELVHVYLKGTEALRQADERQE